MPFVTLPALPKGAKINARLIRFGSDLTPTLGGPVQRVSRLGSRFALDVELPPLLAADARAWVAARLKAEAENATVRLTWPQVAPVVPPFGTVQVDGAGQTGARLAVKGMVPGGGCALGLFFSFADATRHYLHATTENAVASGAGTALYSVAPLLRASPGNNVALNFTAPTIEGLLDGASIDWTIEQLRVSGASFTLTENA